MTTGIDFDAWGKAVAEEVLFRAGLEASDASAKPSAVEAALQFDVSALKDDGALELSFDRIGSSPVKVQIPLNANER